MTCGAIMALMADSPATARRPSSGTVFVLACLAGCAALVAVFVFVSPRLLQATLAQAPDRPPVEVAAGEIDGTAWSVTAVEPDDDRPCARVEVGGEAAQTLCGDADGPSNLRSLDAVEVGDRALVAAIVDPHSVEVRFGHGDTATPADVVYADFGFPLGFAAAAVTEAVDAVTLYGDDGEARGRADCTLEGDDHDPERHIVPPIVAGTGPTLTGGCLLVD